MKNERIFEYKDKKIRLLNLGIENPDAALEPIKNCIKNYKGDALVIPGGADLQFYFSSDIHNAVEELGGEEIFNFLKIRAKDYKGQSPEYGKFELGSVLITFGDKLKKHIIYCVTFIPELNTGISKELLSQLKDNELNYVSQATTDALKLGTDHDLKSMGFTVLTTDPAQLGYGNQVISMLTQFEKTVESNTSLNELTLFILNNHMYDIACQYLE